MKLLTQKVIRKLNTRPIMSTDGQEVKDVIVKFFTPDSNWAFYVVEGSQVGDDWEFFGLVDGVEKEWGTFYLSQLLRARGKLGLPVERDRNFKGTIDRDTKTLLP